MNKQELIDKLKKRLGMPSEIDGSQFDQGFEWATKCDLALITKLDEPEKPVVPQFVADFYEPIKDDFEYGVYELCVNFHNCDLSGKIKHWFDCNDTNPIQVLVNMHQFGYEVEKEKFYTVKFSNEDFGKIYIGIFKKFNKLGISSLPSNDDEIKSWFTEDELKRFKFWDNPAFEIKEVEE